MGNTRVPAHAITATFFLTKKLGAVGGSRERWPTIHPAQPDRPSATKRGHGAKGNLLLPSNFLSEDCGMSEEEYKRQAQEHIDALRELAHRLMVEKSLSGIEAWRLVFNMANEAKLLEWLVDEFERNPPDEQLKRRFDL
jgi:hypothetical protein